MKYIRLTNISKINLVVNSCKIVLKPSGEEGDSLVIDGDKEKDKDILGLLNEGFIKIDKLNRKNAKDPKKEEVVEEIKEKGKKNKKDKKDKEDIANKDGNSVVYIDRGEVKKGKMMKRTDEAIFIDDEGKHIEDVAEDAENAENAENNEGEKEK